MNDSIGMNYCAPDANVWAVNLDGRYMSAVQNYLAADGIPTDGVTKIVSNAAQTLSYCPDPEGIGKCQKTGIVSIFPPLKMSLSWIQPILKIN